MTWYKIAKNTPKEVSLFGELKQTKNGFVYLSIPNKIIDAFLDLIPAEPELLHPKELSDNYVGAHISVMDNEEVEDVKIKEIGNKYHFTIKAVETVKPEGWEEVKRVFFIAVDSPDLEKLRKKYKLSPKLKGHDFHITVGVEKAGKKM